MKKQEIKAEIASTAIYKIKTNDEIHRMKQAFNILKKLKIY